MLNWSAQENARRMTFNLVRYSFIDRAKAKKIFAKIKKMIAQNNMHYDEIRDLASSLSRNAKNAKRDKVASQLLRTLKRF